jgi:hypothetical protein
VAGFEWPPASESLAARLRVQRRRLSAAVIEVREKRDRRVIGQIPAGRSSVEQLDLLGRVKRDLAELSVSEFLAAWGLARVVEAGVLVGQQIDPLPRRGWLIWPFLLFGHLPLHFLNVVTRRGLDPVAVRLHHAELRIVFGLDRDGD